MYRWILILLVLLLPAIAFGQLNQSGGAAGGADADSIVGIPVEDTTGNLADNDVLRYDLGSNSWKHEAPPGAGGGETNTASNLGIDADSIFYRKSGVDLEFRRLIGAGVVTVAASGDTALSITGDIQDSLNILRAEMPDSASVIAGDTASVLRANMGDSARVAAGDSVATALRLAGGTMAGNIVMDNYYITGADVISTDTLIIGEDTLYNEHLIAYLTRLRVRNASAATLTAGTPVYISGITGNRPNVDSARADNAALMPAIGLIEHDISSSADGFVVISGEFGPYNTLAWSVEDPLYVDATGGITSTKPTGANLIQKIGIVTRDNAAVGSIQLVGAGRTNDLPNIASANFWLGNGSGVPTAVTMSGDATMDNAGAVTVSDVDTTGTKIAAALGNRMYNTGDTVSGTYNFSGNPLEFIRMIDFDDTITAPSHLEGRVFYDKTDNTLCYYNNEADVTMNLGQEGWVYARNITGSTILDGKIVYITGAVSSRPTIALANADAEATSKLIGVATHDIETATNGYVTVWGVVRGINLSDFSDGDEVFLSAAVAGSLTTTAPSAPNYVVEVGYVIDASANGDLLVSTGKSKMLNSLGDVLISGPATGNVLVYDGTVWADSESVPLADSATKALGDASGNTITSTYAPLASPTFTGIVTIPDFELYTGGNSGGTYDSTDAPADGDQLTWNTGGGLTWQVAGGGAGEANTLSDSGTYNGTEGFGLAAGKTGVALKVKGLIEGSNITITTSADSGLVIAAGAGAGLDSGEVMTIVRDTTYADSALTAQIALDSLGGHLDSVDVMTIIADSTIQLADMASASVDSTKVADGDLSIDDINWPYEYIYLEMVHGWGRELEDSSYLNLPNYNGSESYLLTAYAGDITPTHSDTFLVSGFIPFACSVDTLSYQMKEAGSGGVNDIDFYTSDISDGTMLTDSLHYSNATARTPGGTWTVYTENITDYAATPGERFGLRFIVDFAADNDSTWIGWVRLAVKR